MFPFAYFGVFLIILSSNIEAKFGEGTLTSLVKPNNNFLFRIIVDCKVKSLSDLEEIANVCRDIGAEIQKPMSILRESNFFNSNRCRLQINYTQKFPNYGVKFSPGRQLQFLVYFGRLEKGFGIPWIYGKTLNLNYTNSVLFIRTKSEHTKLIPLNSDRGYEGSLFSRVPQLTFIARGTAFYKMCLFCVSKNGIHLDHSFVSISNQEITDILEKSLRSIRVTHWVGFINFLGIGEGIFTKEYFTVNPIKFGFSDSEMTLGADMVKYLNMTLLSCPKRDTSICQTLHPEYTIETYVSGVIEDNVHATLILTPPTEELNFLIPIKAANNALYSLLRIPFRWKIMLTTAASILAIFASSVFILMKKASLLSSLSATIGFLIRSTVSQSLTKFSSSSRSIKLITLTWLFSCIVLSELYRGQSIGNFVRPQEGKPIDSFAELIESKAKYSVMAIKRQIQSPNFEGIQKEIMGDLNYTLCNFINSCPACAMIRVELEGTGKSEYRKILEVMTDCNLFITSYKDIVLQLTESSEAMIYGTGALKIIKEFLRSYSPEKKYHIGAHGIEIPVYISVIQDSFSHEFVKFIGYLTAGGVMQINQKNSERVERYEALQNIVDTLNYNNISSRRQTQVTQNGKKDSGMTLKNFRNLFLASLGSTALLVFVFVLELFYPYLQSYFRKLKRCLSLSICLFLKACDLVVRVVLSVMLSLYRVEWKKYFQTIVFSFERFVCNAFSNIICNKNWLKI